MGASCYPCGSKWDQPPPRCSWSSLTGGVDAQTSALGYFITPCVGIFVSIVCYLSLPYMVSLALNSRLHFRASQIQP